MTPRFVIIGAGRTRQGLGPFVARFLRMAGAQVVGHIGTTPASIAATTRMLQSDLEQPCPGFMELGELVRQVEVDALAILCPPEIHARYLEQAVERNLHALCEKPLIMRAPTPERRDAIGGVNEIVRRFSGRGLLLQENCQWPHVLPAFRELFPQTQAAPTQFAMGLSPSGQGVTMAVDSLSHPLSLLQALAPGPARVSMVDWQGDQTPGPRTVRFTYEAQTGPIDCAVFLEDSPARPRPAWVEIDGQRADRKIRTQDYAIFLAAQGRQVPVVDPLQVHVQSFVDQLSLAASDPGQFDAQRTIHYANIETRAQNLHTLLAPFS